LILKIKEAIEKMKKKLGKTANETDAAIINVVSSNLNKTNEFESNINYLETNLTPSTNRAMLLRNL